MSTDSKSAIQKALDTIDTIYRQYPSKSMTECHAEYDQEIRDYKARLEAEYHAEWARENPKTEQKGSF